MGNNNDQWLLTVLCCAVCIYIFINPLYYLVGSNEFLGAQNACKERQRKSWNVIVYA